MQKRKWIAVVLTGLLVTAMALADGTGTGGGAGGGPFKPCSQCRTVLGGTGGR